MGSVISIKHCSLLECQSNNCFLTVGANYSADMLCHLPFILATRLDWGFGNANKTAALIVLLAVGLWVLPFLRRRLFWLALTLSAGLGVCLLLTASRGGLVAASLCVALLLAWAPRPWTRPQIVGGIVALWVIFGLAAWLPIAHRLGKGVSGEDLSVSQRLELWRIAPRMMVDAPGGWGRAQAAEAFRQWYQPLGHAEMFRSLINSHLTWLVEMSWSSRFLYVFGWLVILVVCWPTPAELPQARWLIVPFTLWLGFAVTAWFSSVAESPWLWIIPIVSLLAVLCWRGYRDCWPRSRTWMAAAFVSCFTLCTFYVLGVRSGGQVHLRYTHGSEVVGSTRQPAVWIVANDSVLGKSYGRALRKYLETADRTGIVQRVSVGFVAEVNGLLPTDVEGKTLVVAGTPDESRMAQFDTLARGCSKLILLNPGFYPTQLNAIAQAGEKIVVVAGEFSRTPATTWAEAIHRPVQSVEGAGDFLPRWPELIFENSAPIR